MAGMGAGVQIRRLTENVKHYESSRYICNTIFRAEKRRKTDGVFCPGIVQIIRHHRCAPDKEKTKSPTHFRAKPLPLPRPKLHSPMNPLFPKYRLRLFPDRRDGGDAGAVAGRDGQQPELFFFLCAMPGRTGQLVRCRGVLQPAFGGHPVTIRIGASRRSMGKAGVAGPCPTAGRCIETLRPKATACPRRQNGSMQHGGGVRRISILVVTMWTRWPGMVLTTTHMAQNP